MAVLTQQQVTLAGLSAAGANFAPATATTGDKFQPGANVVLEVFNGGGVSTTVTVDSKTPSNYGSDVNIVVPIPAGERREIGPFAPQRFAGVDGLADVVCAPAASVTIRTKRI